MTHALITIVTESLIQLNQGLSSYPPDQLYQSDHGLLLDDEFLEEVVFDRGEHISAHSCLVITLYIYITILKLEINYKIKNDKFQCNLFYPKMI